MRGQIPIIPLDRGFEGFPADLCGANVGSPPLHRQDYFALGLIPSEDRANGTIPHEVVVWYAPCQLNA